MIHRLIFLERAIDDLEEIVAGFDIESITLGDRFTERVQSTAESLRRLPERVAVVRHPEAASAAGYRRISIRGFPKHLLFFRVQEDVVRVVRILHGARDLRSLLAAEIQDQS